MDISGSYTFNAPPGRVWALLMDPAAIASCVPGCESLEAEGPDRYRARLTVALAAITGTYRQISPAHAGRYLASFAWRYNRRFDLDSLIPRLVHSAVRTGPLPCRMLIAS